jgi:hypothetical protein
METGRRMQYSDLKSDRHSFEAYQPAEDKKLTRIPVCSNGK